MRDGRRKRLGLGGTTTATLNAGEDPGNISTTGISSLINISDLYNNALTEKNATTSNNSYLDRILTDAEAAENPYTIAADTDVNFDTRDFRNISDTYNYYYGGGADASTAPATTTPSTGDGGGGSGDGGTDGGGGTTPNANTPFEDYLIDEGIGIQTEPGTIVAPGEYPSTQDEMDEFNAIPVNQNYNLLNSTYDTEIEDEIYEGPTSTYDAGKEDEIYKETPTVFDGTATLEDAGAGEGDMYTTDFQGGEPLSFDDRNQTFGTVNELTDDPTMQETISNAFTSARQGIGDLATAGVDKIQEVGQSIADTIGGIYNGEDQTITILGKEINVPTTLGGIALGQALNFPVTLAFGALRAIGGLLPQDSLENSTKRSIAAQLTANNTYGYNMGNDSIGQDPFGRNPVSGFGNYEQTLAEDAAYVGDSKFRNAKKDYAQDYFNAKAEKAGGVDMGDGTVLGPGEASDDVVSLEDLLKSQPVTVDKISGDYSPDDDDPANEEPIGDQGSTVNTETGNITDSTGNYAGNIMDEFAAPAPAPAPPAPAPSYNYGGGGGGNGGGGGGGGGSPGSSGPGGSDEMGSFKKGGLAGLKRYAK